MYIIYGTPLEHLVFSILATRGARAQSAHTIPKKTDAVRQSSWNRTCAQILRRAPTTIVSAKCHNNASNRWGNLGTHRAVLVCENDVSSSRSDVINPFNLLTWRKFRALLPTFGVPIALLVNSRAILASRTRANSPVLWWIFMDTKSASAPNQDVWAVWHPPLLQRVADSHTSSVPGLHHCCTRRRKGRSLVYVAYDWKRQAAINV